MLKGRVHSIETFGTVDGPGIRYIIFFQGCPLRCKYCHNRDTWKPNCGKEYTSDELVQDIVKYQSYMQFSGGGVTASGGEATLQADFVAELFAKCKELGIHTCLDTAGFVDIEKVDKLLDYTDLVLLDIKHIDNEKCKKKRHSPFFILNFQFRIFSISEIISSNSFVASSIGCGLARCTPAPRSSVIGSAEQPPDRKPR